MKEMFKPKHSPKIKAKRRRRILERKQINMFNRFPMAARDSSPVPELFNP